MNWPDFTTENAASKRRNTGTFDIFKRRDESSLEEPSYIPIPELNSTGPAHPTFSAAMATRHIRVKSGATKYRFPFEGCATAGTGYALGTLGGVVSAILPITSLYPTFALYELVWSDVSSLRGQSVDLVITLAHSSGAGLTYFRTKSTLYNVEIAGARFSFD